MFPYTVEKQIYKVSERGRAGSTVELANNFQMRKLLRN